MIKGKKAMIESTLAKWILAIIVLIILVIIVFIFKGKGINLFDKIFEILRFER